MTNRSQNADNLMVNRGGRITTRYHGLGHAYSTVILLTTASNTWMQYR